MMKKRLTLLFIVLVQCIIAQQPNILWLTFEDTSPQFIGAYGNENAKTPNMDKLADRGVMFSNAFSNGTVCSPSRSCIITGVRTNVMGTGHHRTRYPVPDFIKGFPAYLRNAGYYTSNNYKTDYNTSDEKRLTDSSWNESSKAAGWWNRKPGQPFFAVFNLFDSHQSRTMTNPWNTYKKQILDNLTPAETVSGQSLQLPPFYPDTPEIRKEHSRIYNALSLTDKKMGEVLSRLEKEGLMDSTIIFVFSDHGEGMPRGKTNGIGLGYRVPFIAWFPEMYKHLSPWGAGTGCNELVSFLDLAPSMLSLSGTTIPEYMKGRPILGAQRKPDNEYLYMNNDKADNSVNLSRSVTDGRYIYTKVFTPYVPENRWIKYFDFSTIEHLMHKYKEDGMLNEMQARTYKPRSFEYLYDIHSDSWEVQNLAYLPEQEEVKKKLSKALDKKLLLLKDVHFIPEMHLKELMERDSTTPYGIRESMSLVNFYKIYSAANLIGDSNNLKKQVRLLESNEPIIRYWASVGIFSHPNIAPYKEEITPYIQDESAEVAINLASASYNQFNSNEGKIALWDYLASENPDEVDACLQALHYIDKSKSAYFINKVKQLFNDKKAPGWKKYSDSAETFLYMHGKLDLHYDVFW